MWPCCWASVHTDKPIMLSKCVVRSSEPWLWKTKSEFSLTAGCENREAIVLHWLLELQLYQEQMCWASHRPVPPPAQAETVEKDGGVEALGKVLAASGLSFLLLTHMNTRPEAPGAHLLSRCLLVLVTEIFAGACKGKTVCCREGLLLIKACSKYQTAIWVLNKWYLVWSVILSLTFFSSTFSNWTFIPVRNQLFSSFIPSCQQRSRGWAWWHKWDSSVSSKRDGVTTLIWSTVSSSNLSQLAADTSLGLRTGPW